MYYILVIGVGNLGSRHLQGLAKSDIPLKIFAVEPNFGSQKIAEKRFKEISEHEIHQISFYSSISQLPIVQMDVVIIATNANNRAELTKELVRTIDVKNIIFEKIAFQSEKQFVEIINLLKVNSISGWVNCPRRCFSFYRNLKEYLLGKGSITLNVTGDEWGLACNSVHFIDLLAFLSNDLSYDINFNNLEKRVFPSKRNGFIELFGSYTGSSTLNNQFSISCTHKKDGSYKKHQVIRITHQTEEIVINEGEGSVRFIDTGSNEITQIKKIKVLYQSELTHIQVNQILNSCDSDLTPIEDSFEIHKPMLKLFRDQYNEITNEFVDNLPIT
jgi:hypothetical protein